MIKFSAACPRLHRRFYGETGKKKLARLQRESYLEIYKSYCAQPSPANPRVCSNESLKKSINKMAKAVVQGPALADMAL